MVKGHRYQRSMVVNLCHKSFPMQMKSLDLLENVAKALFYKIMVVLLEGGMRGFLPFFPPSRTNWPPGETPPS